MCADTDFIEEKENIVIYCVFIKRPQYFIENNEILRLILFENGLADTFKASACNTRQHESV